MKEYTIDQTTAAGMGPECLILNPAFIGKRPREVRKDKSRPAAGGLFGKSFLSRGDKTFFKSMGIAGALFLLAIFF